MPDDIKSAIEGVTKAFSEFKETNDANLKKRDVVLEDRLNKIGESLDKFEALNKQITLAQQAAKDQGDQIDRMEAAMNRMSIGGGQPGDPAEREYGEAFNRLIRLPGDKRASADMEILAKHRNVLVKGDDAGAGYLLAPPEMVREIEKGITDLTPATTIARVRRIGGQSLKQPIRTGRGGAMRVGETQRRADTGEPKFGMIEIPAPEMIARIEVSQQMLEDADYDLLAELREMSAEDFALKIGAEFISGDGPAQNQMQGVLKASGLVSVAGGSATAITADGLINLYYSIQAGYARNGLWLMNRKTVGEIRKLKDANTGNYVWQPGITNNVPNTILGSPYIETPDMPDVAADALPVAFGDWKRAYTITDRIGLAFQTDYTSGADDGLVVFRGRKRMGGGVIQKDAYRALKIAA